MVMVRSRRTGRLHPLNLKKSKKDIQSHRKFRGKRLTAQHRRNISKGLRKTMSKRRTSFGLHLRKR